MTKRILNYHDLCKMGRPPKNTAASHKKYRPQDLNRALDRLPVNEWVMLKKYDKESQCVVYAFYFDEGDDEKEDDSKTLEGPFIPNFHD